MPSQQEVQWSQLKIGVLVIVALAVLTGLVFLMSGQSGGFFTPKITVHSFFENSQGLKNGAPVNLEGVTIGNVEAVRIVPSHNPTPVEVIMKLNKKFAGAIHADSKSSLETVGVLGDTVIDINSTMATKGPVQDGAELPTNETPDLSDVIKSSQGTIEQLNTILAKVDKLVDTLNSSKGSIGAIINDPTLYNKAISTVNQVQKLVDQVSSGRGSIGKLMVDDTLYNRANAVVGNLEAVSKDLNSGHGTIGKMIKDPALYNNLEKTTANLNKLLGDVNAGKGSIGMMAKDPAFARKLNDTVTKLDSILGRVDRGEGTAGKLVRDAALYNHLNDLATNASGLVTKIRENPKQYLTIHMKIF